MVQESRKLMKKILTEIRTIDNILYRNLWFKNILEDRVTAFLYHSTIVASVLIVVLVFLPSYDSGERFILYFLIIISILSLALALRNSKKKIKDIERYNKNLRCWRGYLAKERDAMLRDDPSLSDVEPGLSWRLIWDMIYPCVAPFLVLFMFVAVHTGIAYEFFCIISGLIALILLFALYMGLDRPYEGKPCIERK